MRFCLRNLPLIPRFYTAMTKLAPGSVASDSEKDVEAAAAAVKKVDALGGTTACGRDDTSDVASDEDDGPELDPWSSEETVQENSPNWNELGLCGKLYRVFVQWIGKVVALVSLLYFFICSLDLLGSSFRLLGGRAAGAAFSDNQLLQNPIAGLMIGVLATVLVQSSSTSSSIVVTMVASGILKVQPAIPIIMGANIGTSVTNTIVSLAQSSNRDEFRRAFAGATVHDMFNWLTVIILLPIEVATGYLYHLTSFILSSFQLKAGFAGANKDMLQTITKPFTELIVQLDKKVIEGIATGDAEYADKPLIKEWCRYTATTVLRNVTSAVNETSSDFNSTSGTATLVNVTEERNVTVRVGVETCTFLFYNRGLDDMVVGAIILVFSLLLLCGSLVLMVKILNSALRGSVLKTVKRTVNAELPGCAAYFTGYIAMIVGALMTMVVQSSSVFTSVLTPLVGVGVVSIERMYPLTLGSNIGTTTTGVLAALAASADQLAPALQIALCHLFFNLTGIAMFYPVPCTRVPIRLAKLMGSTTARYRWFALFYVVAMFFAIPMTVFALSMAGTPVLMTVVAVVVAVLAFVVTVNVLQRRRPRWLPKKLRSWDFLPLWMHSLDPADRVVGSLVAFVGRFCCFCGCCVRCCPHPEKGEEMKTVATRVTLLTSVESRAAMMATPDDDEEKQPQTTIDDGDRTSAKIRYMLAGVPLECPKHGCDSAYCSAACTPAPSRLPSYTQLPLLVAAEMEAAAARSHATPTPSRLPSYARFDAIIEIDASTSEDEAAAGVKDTGVKDANGDAVEETSASR